MFDEFKIGSFSGTMRVDIPLGRLCWHCQNWSVRSANGSSSSNKLDNRPWVTIPYSLAEF